MDVGPVVLEGEFVRLEPMRLEHAEALVAVGLGQDIFRHFPIAMETPEQMEAYVRLCVAGTEAGNLLTWVTVARESGQPVGSTGYLNIDRHNRKLEIGGTWVAPAWQRTFRRARPWCPPCRGTGAGPGSAAAMSRARRARGRQ